MFMRWRTRLVLREVLHVWLASERALSDSALPMPGSSSPVSTSNVGLLVGRTALRVHRDAHILPHDIGDVLRRGHGGHGPQLEVWPPLPLTQRTLLVSIYLVT